MQTTMFHTEMKNQRKKERRKNNMEVREGC